MKSFTSIKKTREFGLCFKKGNSYVTYGFVCYWLERAPIKRAPPGNRLGIVASKKVGNAIKRNRAKRVIREAFRLAEGELRQKTAGKSYDFVFVARGKTPYLKSTRIHELMQGLFQRLPNV